MRYRLGQGASIERCALRRGFTLVELLVVIAIIGVLVALLLPAVQAARESARRMQCQNHLKQIGLAFQNHHDTLGHLPTGGWGWSYVGDPDLGFAEGQPGGWTYNILPFIEQKNLREIGTGSSGPLKLAELKRLVETPIKFYNCPSRRPAELYPVPIQPTNAAAPVTKGAKTDYSVNAGDQLADQNGAGSPTAAIPPAFKYTGICFERSRIRLSEISDGTSNTVMVGEKHLAVQNYRTGTDGADNENLYVGFDNDHFRSMNNTKTGAVGDIRFPPRSDTRTANLRTFGSAHPSGFNALLCDGSVRVINYTIHEVTYMRLGHRGDGESLGSFSASLRRAGDRRREVPVSTPLLAILPRNRNLAPGQRVQIIAGPLRGLRGSVTETADSLFVQIRLDIPGVCVRVPARQVAAEREQPPTD